MITHTERLRVQWIDTDASGIIHYTAALRYFEVAEHALLRKLLQVENAVGASSPSQGGLPRVHVEADYKRPLRYPELFDCTARVAAVGGRSVTYAFAIQRPDGEACIEGRIVAVCVGPDGRSAPLPAALRQAFARARGDTA